MSSTVTSNTLFQNLHHSQSEKAPSSLNTNATITTSTITSIIPITASQDEPYLNNLDKVELQNSNSSFTTTDPFFKYLDALDTHSCSDFDFITSSHSTEVTKTPPITRNELLVPGTHEIIHFDDLEQVQHPTQQKEQPMTVATDYLSMTQRPIMKDERQGLLLSRSAPLLTDDKLSDYSEPGSRSDKYVVKSKTVNTKNTKIMTSGGGDATGGVDAGDGVGGGDTTDYIGKPRSDSMFAQKSKNEIFGIFYNKLPQNLVKSEKTVTPPKSLYSSFQVVYPLDGRESESESQQSDRPSSRIQVCSPRSPKDLKVSSVKPVLKSPNQSDLALPRGSIRDSPDKLARKDALTSKSVAKLPTSLTSKLQQRQQQQQQQQQQHPQQCLLKDQPNGVPTSLKQHNQQKELGEAPLKSSRSLTLKKCVKGLNRTPSETSLIPIKKREISSSNSSQSTGSDCLGLGESESDSN
eukprot:TRINITY_DN10154_c0_g2_i1.p1 TRINITY_DN10154_c0_g2~~TRINITY_DN10154_c0_g2_i1.p1  ORF type:complete len:465 (-),score=119.14 TRINITY_DN10154_c0_g2_i1:271-1665(-)